MSNLANRSIAAALVAMSCAIPAPVRAQAAESPPSTCDYTSRDWSTMRSLLEDIAKFKGSNDAGVQEIARRALAGDERVDIGPFEVHYAYHRYDRPPPNNAVCYPQRVTFTAARNADDGNDGAYACDARLSPGGEVESIACTLVAD
jgi:hypothetical protein